MPAGIKVKDGGVIGSHDTWAIRTLFPLVLARSAKRNQDRPPLAEFFLLLSTYGNGNHSSPQPNVAILGH